MSWSTWSAKLNVQSIVSQGLEQVSKLKEDVEKQFDQVVTASSAQPPGSTSRASATAASSATTAGAAGAHEHGAVEPPSPAVNAALFGDADSFSAVAPPPPPRSLDSTSSAALLASLGLTKASSGGGAGSTAGGTDAPSSAPTSRTSKSSSAAADFFGSYLPADPSKPSPATTETPALEQPSVEENESREVATIVKVPKASDADATDEIQTTLYDAEKQDEGGDGSMEQPVVDGVDADEDPTCGAALETERTAAETHGVSLVNASHEEDGPVRCIEAEHSIQDMAVEVSSQSDHAPVEEEEEVEEQSNGSFQQFNGLQHQTGDTSESNKLADTLVDEAADDADETRLLASSGEVQSLKEQLAQRETQLMSTSAVIQELHDELDKTCQREVAAVEKNRFLNEQLELLRHEVLRLNRVVAQQQQQAGRDQELAALQQAIAEKDDKLQALLDEGQALSVKQSQLEQRLRQLRREKNEEEEQKLKLQAQSDTLAIQLQETATKQKSAEAEKKNLQSELKAAQLLVGHVQSELTSAQDELMRRTERTAELEADAGSLREENETMRAELERLQHTSDSHATLSVEKSEMEATIQYLQQTVVGLEAENARREDMTRMEITDLKRKWKDALQRVEALGHSVSEATQPLLRQIHALQEDQRGRQDTWKATEQTLVQRISDATAQRRAMETEKLAREAQLHEVQAKMDDLQHIVDRKEAEAVREKERVEATLHKEREARSKCDALQIELEELKHKYQEEQHAKQALLARVAMVATADSTAKRESDAQVVAETTSLVAEMQQLKQREEQLRHDLEWHQKELQRVKAATASPRMAVLQPRRSFDEDWSGSADGSPRVTGQGNASQASILQRTLETSVDDSRLSSTSVLGLSQLQQRLRLREGENRLIRQQLQTLEDKQKQTTDEIVRLSTRNALLESSATQFEETQQQLEQLKQKQHVLLELFGEKEEQVEELQSEVKELKAFYRKQLDTLAGQQK